MQFIDSDEVELWKRSIRYAADRLRFTNFDPIPTKLSEYAARVVERAKDYDINTYRIYKVVKRNNLRNVSRSSVDDFHKASPTVCFLAIGTHLVHIIALPKHLRVSTPTLSEVHEGDSFGILSLTGVQVNENDDNFSLSFRYVQDVLSADLTLLSSLKTRSLFFFSLFFFPSLLPVSRRKLMWAADMSCIRLPFQDTCVLHLASLASCEIALRLRQVENFLRPGWLARPYFFDLPAKVEDNFIADDPPPDDGFESFDRTMIAYCVAYGVNPISIRYRVDDGEQVEDAPRFQLLEPEAGTIRGYTPQQLLAIFRSLRFNEAFGTISFAGISLDCINGIGDRFGAEHLPSHSVHVTPFGMSPAEQHEASLLVQEIRALAISTTALRRLDFSFCISKPDSKMPTFAGRSTAVGCGAVEALFPLCKQQATNVDWIALNGIELQETDLDYLVSIAAEKAAHFRAVEASRCGLTDRGIALLLDVFKAHQNTLEALDISSNTLRLAPMILSSQLGVFGHIRKLNLSNLAVTSTTEPLIPLEILSQWRLDTLHLSGIPLNEETLEVLCNYVGLFQSLTLRELWLCNCNLNGDEAAGIMQALSHEEGAARFCHLNLGENPLATKPDKMASAIAKSQCPTQLSLRSIEYDLQDVFEELLLAFAANKSIRSLDIARTSLPGEAGEGVCKAMEKLLADNNTLIDIDISGEESRLETSKLGMGINEALNGLKTNGSLQVLRVQLQKLGMQGASTLADVLKANKTLRELHCDFNAITLPGFTDLVNSLAENTTILFLPPFSESRYAALRQTEEQIRIARTKTDETMMGSSSSKISSVRRTFSTLGAGIAPSQFGSSKSSSSRVGAVPQWTEQDVQAALRLVNEGWEDQARRLNQYLARNWRILHGVEDITSGTVSEGEKDQRPGTAGSIGKVLQKVASQSTPTMEKDAQLVLEEDARPSEARSATDSPEAVEQEQNSPQHAQFGDLPIDDAHFLRQNIFEPGSPNMSPTSPLSPPYLMAEEQRHERESSGDDESSGNDVDDFHDARSKKESDESGKSEQ